MKNALRVERVFFYLYKGIDMYVHQGCQMAYFQNKNPKLGKFWRDLEWKMLAYLYGDLEFITAVWYILCPFGNLVVIWYIFPVLVYCVKKNMATLMYICENVGGGGGFSALFCDCASLD
jgi:hypothetical protein